MKKRLLVFDMDGTLYRQSSPSNTYTGSKLEETVNQNARNLIIKQGWADESTVDIVIQAGLTDPIGLSNYFQTNFNIARSEYFNKVWDINPEGMLKDYKETIEVIQILAATNTLILLTSAPKVWQQQVCNYLDIRDLFDRVITGEQFGKKDEIFEQLSREYNSSNAISIGDQLKTDIEPATKYGFQTLLVKKPQDLQKLLKDKL